MIDATTLRRDVRADIADWPALIRHYYNDTQYVEIAAAMSTEDTLNLLQEGGLLDDTSFGILAVAEDFTQGLPQARQRIDLKQRDGSWLKQEVKRTPDFHDAIAVHIQFTIGTPDK